MKEEGGSGSGQFSLRKTQLATAGFEDGGMGHEPSNTESYAERCFECDLPYVLSLVLNSTCRQIGTRDIQRIPCLSGSMGKSVAKFPT